ncbi:DUF192 domain-containing protein [Dechloromonas sp. A34]|uniref:DUF192 domain-containing protein n=1 Tax=Dechloromonas sp. A34 TaxID=447588 RepID=UPI00224989CD|nr:DUF192 domain-containing protein [Dechloromonas sp. A34]
MNKRVVAACLGLILSAAVWAQNAMPLMELSAGMHRIEAEVAADQQNRMLGLMNRKAMAPQRGMLFVFPQQNTHCMWMRNTLIPLSVAFLDEDGIIINIENMQPQTEDNHCARVPARYALEMNLGWFAQRGIKPGTRLKGIDKAPRPQ